MSNFGEESSVLLFEKVPEVFLCEFRRHVSHPQGRTRASEGKQTEHSMGRPSSYTNSVMLIMREGSEDASSKSREYFTDTFSQWKYLLPVTELPTNNKTLSFSQHVRTRTQLCTERFVMSQRSAVVFGQTVAAAPLCKKNSIYKKVTFTLKSKQKQTKYFSPAPPVGCESEGLSEWWPTLVAQAMDLGSRLQNKESFFSRAHREFHSRKSVT